MANETSKKIEQTGDRTLIVTLVNGIKHGEICLKNQGKKELEGNYENGVLNGRFIRYWSNGSPMSVFNYKFGAKNGPFVFFYQSGVKQLTGNYTNDQYDGIITTYDEFGDVIATEQYVNGVLHGKSIKYYPKNISFEGKTRTIEIAFYENGLLHGNKVSFSLSGKVTSVIPYYKGRPLRYGTMTI